MGLMVEKWTEEYTIQSVDADFKGIAVGLRRQYFAKSG